MPAEFYWIISDAKSLDGCDIIDPVPFFHLEGPGPDDLPADLDTQPAANTPVGGRSRVYVICPGKFDDGLGLGGPLKQVFNGFGSISFNCLATGFNNHSVFYFQDTRQHRKPFTGGVARYFDRTQAAGAGRFQ